MGPLPPSSLSGASRFVLLPQIWATVLPLPLLAPNRAGGRVLPPATRGSTSARRRASRGWWQWRTLGTEGPGWLRVGLVLLVQLMLSLNTLVERAGVDLLCT